MKAIDELIEQLKEIPFFKDGMHPEYFPFVGTDYTEHRVLQVAESHYIPNFEKDTTKDNTFYKGNDITVEDFAEWWDGNVPDKIIKYKAWYTTDAVVKDYMNGSRHKGHGVFTNVLKSFCEAVEPNKTINKITRLDSQKYNYFAYMNFWQIPSLYFGENFSTALFESMRFCYSDLDKRELLEKYDEYWYKCFFKSVEVFEAVVKVLEPNVILITSAEVSKSYKKYGIQVTDDTEAKYRDRNGKLFKPGILDDPDENRIIYLDHPGCSWWNRAKAGETETSKQKIERKLKEMKQKGYI